MERTLILRPEAGGKRVVAALCTMQDARGHTFEYVRIGQQYLTDDGRWLWSKGDGVTVPTRKLRDLGVWLVTVGRLLSEQQQPRDHPVHERSRFELVRGAAPLRALPARTEGAHTRGDRRARTLPARVEPDDEDVPSTFASIFAANADEEEEA